MSIILRSMVAVLVLGVAARPTSNALAQGGQAQPDGAPITRPPNTPGNTATFQVTKNGGTRELVRFLCDRSGDVVSCTPPVGVYIDPGQTVDVNLTFTTGSQGAGTATLVAWGPEFGEDSGWVKVAVLAPAAGTTYTLTYVGGSGPLDRITDPAGRVLAATVSGGLMATLKDPSGDSVVYGYDSEQRLTTRTNRRGHETMYRYNNSLRITSVETPLSSPTDLGITSLSYWDEGGLVIGQPGGGPYTAKDPAAVYTHLDGPRIDAADATRFWVDRWGAPTRIEQDALGVGYNTYLARGDPNVPALVTQVQAPNGFITRATYDARGNMLTTTEVGPYSPSDPRDAVTNYSWHPTWDFVTKIKRPEGDSLVFEYSASSGNRLWQQDGRGFSSRVQFNYVNFLGLLSSIDLPGGARDSILYSGELGNPFWFRTSLGYVTTHRQDLMGRDTLVLTPISSGYEQQQRFVYDAVNRVLQQQAVGPAMPGVAAETVLVRNFYDREGNLDSLSRESKPDVAGIGQIVTRWWYDAAGRRIKEVAPGGVNRDSMVYDPAGNLSTVFTRRGHTLSMVYDTLNRLKSRTLSQADYGSRQTNFNITSPRLVTDYAPYTIPAETHTFTYDADGRLLTADNADAKVKRSYFPNGLLKTDSLRIQTVARDNWEQHKYGLAYAYDLDGRRTSLTIPQALAAGGGATISYIYHPQLAALQSITDVQGAVHSLGYNDRGELTSIGYPGQYNEALKYDADGRLAADTIWNDGGTSYPRISTNLVRSTSLAYDRRDRIVSISDPSAQLSETNSVTYTGLGHLLRSQRTASSEYECGPAAGACWYAPERVVTVETYTMDALANRTVVVTEDTVVAGGMTITSSTETATYQPSTGQLLSGYGNGTNTTYSYDVAGNIEFMATLTEPAQERASFLAADGSLRRTEYRWATKYNGNMLDQKYAVEEYRYDALGRRVWLKAEKWCVDGPQMDLTDATECRTSLLRRTIWDGDQELAEIQMPWGFQAWQGYTVTTTPEWWENDVNPVNLGTLPTTQGTGDANPYFGHVIYAGAGVVDQPVAITRVNYVMALDLISRQANYQVKPPFTINPFWSAKGNAPLGVFSNGARALCDPPTSLTACVALGWPWYESAFDQQRGLKRDSWHGTILEGKRDKSGLSYSRNRYYDPSTGRFTQEDPIGLAGGLNLYGFANGDPINFSDPFGLCDKIKDANGKETNAPCILFAVLAGEARGASRQFQTGVANVIKNRANLVGGDYDAVINQPGQFSAMNAGDPNRAVVDRVLATGEISGDLRDIIEGVYNGTIGDNTRGALLYYSPRSMTPAYTPPGWDFGQLTLTRYTSAYDARLRATVVGGEGLFFRCRQGTSCWSRP